jgi:hypothetical protein
MYEAATLEPLIPEDDPLWRKFLSAPVDPNPAPEQELLGLEQLRAGAFVDGSAVSAEIDNRARHEEAANIRTCDDLAH